MESINLLISFVFNRYMHDWENFRSAFIALTKGLSPYSEHKIFNPVWALYLITPIMVMPNSWQPFVLMLAYLSSAILIAKLFRYRGISLFFILSNPALWFGIGYGNVDWLAWLGLLLPTPIGIIFLAIKPQVTWVAILVLLLREWKQGKLLLSVIPISVLSLYWLFVYGFQYTTQQNIGNAVGGIWPYSLILGIPLVIVALWKQNIKLAILAAPFCTPYFSSVSMASLSYVNPAISWIVLWGFAFDAIPRLMRN